MRGMFLNFASEAGIEEALEEYALALELDSDWIDHAEVRDRIARLVETGRGTPKEVVLAHLDSVYGAPQFKSPAQRRWFFATQPQKAPKQKKEKSTADRWTDIMQATRDVLKQQPNMTGEELIGAVGGAVDPDLSDSEEERVRKLVSPERAQKLVGPPERTPKEEVTPETVELVEQEWARIQEERKEEKEKKEERTEPQKGPGRRPRSSPGKGMIPPFVQPGIPHRGAKKESYPGKEEYLLCKFPDMTDADNLRAFSQAVTLVRSCVDDKDIKCRIESEYPEVCPDEVLKAAKDFVKSGANDPYISGAVLASTMVQRGGTPELISDVYANMERVGISSRYLDGFRTATSM